MCALDEQNFWRQQLFASFNQEIGMKIEQIDFSVQLFHRTWFQATLFRSEADTIFFTHKTFMMKIFDYSKYLQSSLIYASKWRFASKTGF